MNKPVDSGADEADEGEDSVEITRPRAPMSVRAMPQHQTVRVSLLKPILNMSRFFVGDTIPRVKDAKDTYDRIRDMIARNIPFKESDKGLLNKLIMLLMKQEKDPNLRGPFNATRLLTGLVLFVIEDDYFFIPEVSEHASLPKLEELAQELGREHQARCDTVFATVMINKLQIRSADELDAVAQRLPGQGRTEEVYQVIARLRTHLREGERIFSRHAEGERKQKHAERLKAAYSRAANLIARLIAVSPESDHERLRARIKLRELQRIEIDALGAQVVSERDQEEETRNLLRSTEVEGGLNLSTEMSVEQRQEVATQLEKLMHEAEEEDEGEEKGEGDEEAGWFFDME